MARIMSEAWHITLATKRLEYMRAEAYWAKRRRETEKALVNWHVNKTKMLSVDDFDTEKELKQFNELHSSKGVL